MCLLLFIFENINHRDSETQLALFRFGSPCRHVSNSHILL
jgi:hypothetical protein